MHQIKSFDYQELIGSMKIQLIILQFPSTALSIALPYEASLLPPTSNRLIRRVHRLLALLLNMLSLHMIRLIRIPPHILLALLRLFRLRRTSLSRIADRRLNGSRVRAAGARVCGAAAVDVGAVGVDSGGGLGTGSVRRRSGVCAAVVGGEADGCWGFVSDLLWFMFYRIGITEAAGSWCCCDTTACSLGDAEELERHCYDVYRSLVICF